MLSTRTFTLLMIAAFGSVFAIPQAHAASCGNGVVNTGEECDDANTSPTDGCAPNCTIYPGWTCSGSPSVCTSTCGDNVVTFNEGCDDGNTTSGDGCQANCTVQPGYQCTGNPSVCLPSEPSLDCGNGVVDSGEQCDDGDTTSGDGCQSDCTVQSGYECTGSPSVCVPSEPAVNCGNGIVDAGEDCDGGACCTDCTFTTAGTTCRASGGACDVAEACTGSSGSCPSDKHLTTVCRASLGGCDPAEFCSTTSNTCPTDVKKASNTICRASAGACDIAETCSGTSDACPADALQPSTTVCRPAVSTACDVAESCTGTSTTCPTDVLVGCPDTDGIDCVHPACDVSGQCTTTSECSVICRQSGFWATRSTIGSDSQSLLESVLDEVGSISVCGQTIDASTDLGDLGSAIEALCVRTQGVDERELYRQLVTTALNCAISEGGTCDQILGSFVDVSFTACNSLCAGTPPPGGPTIEECIDQLSCFNSGGQTVDGQCARGTCASDPTQMCGGDFGSCSGGGTDDGDDDDGGEMDRHAGLSGQLGAGSGGAGHGNGIGLGSGAGNGNETDDGEDEDGCVPFEDNCAGARLCSTSTDAVVQICPRRTRPSNQHACRDARKNQCTIDSCD